MFTDLQGNKIFVLGINYWPSSSGLNMWSDWNEKELEEDVVGMKKIGVNVCRFFLFMPDFLPDISRVDPVMLKRLKIFMNICEKYEMYSMPTFIIGHMSGEDWDVNWREGRNFLTDKEVIKITKMYVKEIINSIKVYKYLMAWLLSNELSNYVGQQNPDIITAWTREIIATVKKYDPARPVCLGDGAWAPEIVSDYKRWKFQLRKLNQYQDFVGLHYYPRVMYSLQHDYTTAFRLRMAQQWDKPVFVEEFGTSTVLCSEENQAHYYRSVFYSALINNSFGAMGWCLNDFDFENKRPYSHHAFEERFGLVKTDKSLKPAAGELTDFKKIADELYSDYFKKIEHNAGLLIPSNYYYEYPYQFEPEFNQWYAFYLETFAHLKNGINDVECMIEPAIDLNNEQDIQPVNRLESEPPSLLFAPRLKIFIKSYWRKIIDYIKKGGNLYCSFANDSWVLDWHTVAGVEMDCKFGIPDFRNSDHLEITVLKEWGEFSHGDKFTIPLQNDHPEKSYCPILNTTAEVIMIDQFGDPFLIKNKIGEGSVYFTPYPVEILSLESLDHSWKPVISKIYRSIYEEIYTKKIFRINGYGFETGIWKHVQKDLYKIIILNHSWENNRGEIELREYYKCMGNDKLEVVRPGIYSFELGRKEVLVLNINYKL
ncbi:MAG: glycoside hydrolase 5 family protein [Fidelibacterota bacterium]